MLYFWIFFNLFALAMLVGDLKLFHRKGHVVGPKEALIGSGLWIGLALAFALVIYFWQGRSIALDFVTGYVLELSLSVDNLFVFLLVFRYFTVPEEQQHRVLFWGIIGAMAMRAIFIIAGVGLIQRFHWILYGFGILLVYSGIRLMFAGGHQVNPANNPLVKALRRWMPVTDTYEGGKFFIRNRGAGSSPLCATPLLLVLVVIETSDLLFAVDSIPAVLAITLNTFIVYTSNIFAILGLRSMYFALSGLMKMFRYLHYGLAVILMLVGIKMLAADYYRVSTLWTLVVIAAVLTVSIATSMMGADEVENKP
ncbi:MAG TPA: TerC family protein [Candidatus Sulfotelmatobacter sp.]